MNFLTIFSSLFIELDFEFHSFPLFSSWNFESDLLNQLLWSDQISTVFWFWLSSTDAKSCNREPNFPILYIVCGQYILVMVMIKLCGQNKTTNLNFVCTKNSNKNHKYRIEGTVSVYIYRQVKCRQLYASNNRCRVVFIQLNSFTNNIFFTTYVSKALRIKEGYRVNLNKMKTWQIHEKLLWKWQ